MAAAATMIRAPAAAATLVPRTGAMMVTLSANQSYGLGILQIDGRSELWPKGPNGDPEYQSDSETG
ncbi:hypothetical protein V7x_01340 [Crateriforma conspicua]|uniref:Uncharacterized protein n=1 Tax=Crateriforma conspicua TaxID=2527996 RepID=A0A5C6FSZ1_9PLAN|nr:hypothetical protein [Crateriforma conspicua]TWU64590.1 hypothetical protein V7x_01340 [Crateriforma conspicua]